MHPGSATAPLGDTRQVLALPCSSVPSLGSGLDMSLSSDQMARTCGDRDQLPQIPKAVTCEVAQLSTAMFQDISLHI